MFDMAVVEAPLMPASEGVVVAQASSTLRGITKSVHVFGAFYWNGQQPGDGLTWDVPNEACEALKQEGFFGQPGGGQVDEGNFNCLLLAVDKRPSHGKLLRNANGTFTYVPTAGFVGTERTSFIVQAEGKRVRVVYEVHVQREEPVGEVQ